MELKNSSQFSLFSLSGLENETKENRHVLFSVTCICFIFIVIINLTLLFTIHQEKSLHEPMYLFLCNLCINALYGTAGFYPKFLSDLLSEHHVISYEGCLLQAFVIYSNALCDYSILTVMAYDRYVAICRPLEYHSIMTNQAVVKFIVLSWIPSFFCQGILVFLIYRLKLCRSNIEKLYCSNWAIVRLSCSSTTMNNVAGFVVIFVYVGHLLFITYSYVKLIRTSIKSAENRQKAMQTCMPHLLTLTNVTVALFFDVMYSRYGSRNIQQDLRNFLELEFLVIPPLLNPIIYGMQLAKLRRALMSLHKKVNEVT